MFFAPHSTARQRVIAPTAALDAQYARLRFTPILSKNEPMLMIVPPPALTRWGYASRQTVNTDVAFVRMTCSYVSSVSSWLGASRWIPALLTTPCTPSTAIVASAARTLLSAVKSQRAQTKRAASSAGNSAAGGVPRRLRQATRKPRRASSTAMAAPIPRLVPVTAMRRLSAVNFPLTLALSPSAGERGLFAHHPPHVTSSLVTHHRHSPLVARHSSPSLVTVIPHSPLVTRHSSPSFLT